MTGTQARATGRWSRWGSLPLAALALLHAAATCSPPPDTDGEPSVARALELDRWHDDELLCKKNDCADWYLVRLRSRGRLRVEVEPAAGGEKSTRFHLAVADHRAKTLRQSEHSAGGKAALNLSVQPGPYFVKVGASDQATVLSYRLRVMLEVPKRPPPPPPEPRISQVRAEVLEVEGSPGEERFVLFGSGKRDGLRPGLRGRLIQDGVTIAPIEVKEVFPEGSRARLILEPSRPITPDAMVEIDVPVDDPAPLDDPDGDL